MNGIPSNDFARAIREDPRREGLLYLGTEHGIYVSFDNGQNWQSLRLNLPDTQVPDLMIDGDDLVIATHGRSFNVLDGTSALRQFTPAVASSGAHLFAPGVATRSLKPAYIDYFLKNPAENVTITVLDSAGKVVQTFTSSNSDKQAPATLTEAAPGVPATGGAKGPSRNAGLNRFSWDLHYPGATVFPGMVLRGGSTNGPLAVPGAYKVQLAANGQTETQTLTIEKDPRLTDVTDADLREQFALAMQVRDATSHCNEMVIRIRAMKKQIDDRLAKNTGAQIASVAQSVKVKLSGIEEELYQVKNRSPRDTLNYPIKLNNQLATLMSMIEMGDSKPTSQMYTVFQELSATLAKLTDRLNTAESTDLAHLNELLKNSQLEPIAGR